MIVTGVIGFIGGLVVGGGGSTNLNENDNQNFQDLASFINQTSDDRNIVIVVNNLGERIPYNQEMGYGYNYTKR